MNDDGATSRPRVARETMSSQPVSLEDLPQIASDRGWSLLESCPLCGCPEISLLGLGRGTFGICSCLDCKIVFLNPRRSSRWHRYRESTMQHGYLARQIELGLLTPDLEPNLPSIIARSQRIVEMVKAAPPGPIIELGCGIGLTLLALQASGLDARGIEVGADFADFADRMLGLDVSVWDLRSAPPLKERAAVVVLNSVLEQQNSPVEFLRLVREKVLRPDGEVVIAAPNLRSVQFVEMGMSWPVFEKTRLWYFTDDTLERVARRAGYRIAGSHWKARRDRDDIIGRTFMYVHDVLGLDINVTGGIALRLAPTH